MPIWLCFSDICLIDFHENCKSTFTFFANCIWTLSHQEPLASPAPAMYVPKPHKCRVCPDMYVECWFVHICPLFPFVCGHVCVCVWKRSEQLPISTPQICWSPTALCQKLGLSILLKKNQSLHYYLWGCWSARWIEKAPRIIIIYGAEHWFANIFLSPGFPGFFASWASLGAVRMEHIQNLKTSPVNWLLSYLKLKK